MLDYKPIKNIDDINLIKKYTTYNPERVCDYSSLVLYMWKDYYHFEYCIYEEVFFLRRKDKLYYEYYLPLEKFNIEHIKLIIENEKENDVHFVINSNNDLDLLSKYYKLDYIFDRDFCDYLYNFNDLKTFKGKKYSSKRNLLHQFINNYPNYKLEKITKSNINETIIFATKHLKFLDNEDAIYENKLDLDVLNNYFELDLEGYILKVNDKIEAFMIYEIIDDLLIDHIEKANISYKGIYQALNYLIFNVISAPSLKYINKENDAGDEGLRTSKLSYHPLKVIEYYNVTIKK